MQALGGHVESALEGRLVIAAPAGAMAKLAEHPAVKYAQVVAVGPVETEAELPAPRTMAAVDMRMETHAGQTWTSGDYAYDGAGNIVAIGTTSAPGTQGYRTYGYDKVSRLTKATIGVAPVATHEYGYDEYGNRNQNGWNGQWVAVPASVTTNRLTDASYDAAGNQTSRGATSATYDGFGMTTSYRFDAVNAEAFVYTATDERIGVLRGTQWMWSLRDTGGQVIRQYRSSSTNPAAPWLWVEDFVYRDGLLLGSERVPEEGGRRHYHLDHLGSARLVTGADGSVISEHDFLPFGEERTLIGQQLAKGFDREEPHRFTGHERDFDVAMPNASSSYVDYMHARYYAARTGRFLSVDPILGDVGEPQAWNRYVYVLNNPITLVDPAGLAAVPTSGPGKPDWCTTPVCEEFEYLDPDPGGAGEKTIHTFRDIDDFFRWWNGFNDRWSRWAAISTANSWWWGGDGTLMIAQQHGYSTVEACIYGGGPCDPESFGFFVGANRKTAFNRASKLIQGSRYTPDQAALISLAKEAARRGVTKAEAMQLIKWAKEYGVPYQNHIGTSHWIGGPHIRIGNINHIRVH